MRVLSIYQISFSCILLFVFVNVIAVKPYKPEISDPFLETWRWKHFNELDGKGVKNIVEGSYGDVWFATNQGIYKYDGYSFHLQDTLNGLTGLPVYQITKTHNGEMYAATSDGLFKLRNNSWENIFSDPTHSFEMLTIKEIRGEGVFCLTENGFIRIIHSNVIQIFTSPGLIEMLSDKYMNTNIDWIALPPLLFQTDDHLFTDIIKDDEGHFWLCLNQDEAGYVLKFKELEHNGDFTTNYSLLSSRGEFKFGRSQKMLKSASGDIWIISGKFRVGIHRFSRNNHQYIQLSNLFGGDEYHWSIMQNKKNEIFISGLGQFFVYSNNQWKQYTADLVPLPPSCRIIMYETDNGNLWIGGLQNKIYKLDYSYENWLTYKNLNFQCESPDNKNWFIEADGRIVVNDGNKWISYGPEDGLMDTPVRLICTRNGQLWAAGSQEGVAATAHLENSTWTVQKHPSLSWGIDYRSVFEAKDGSLWFGAAVDYQKEKGQKSGLLHLLNPLEKEKHWVHYHTPEHGSMSLNTYGVAQSLDGRIWKGGLGLSFFSGERWFQIESPEELTDYVNVVHSRPGVKLYAGSRYYGLFVFDGDKWQVFNSNSGLLSNTIISIYAESDSSIWLATDNDISYFDGNQWFVDLFPTEMTMKMEGGSLHKDSSGQLWINKSPREWKRRAFEYSQTPPEVYEKYKVYRYKPYQGAPKTFIKKYPKQVSSSGQVTFFWEGKDYLKNTENSRLKYSYRINGGKWSKYTSETNKTFYNLNSGDYVFEVKAIDLDMNTNHENARAKFVVNPPIWKQGWFILLLSGMVFITVYFTLQIIKRDRKLVMANDELNHANHILSEQKQEITAQKEQLNLMLIKNEQLSHSKLKFYTNISHEFRTPLTLILANIENLFIRNLNFDKRKQIYDVIQRNSRRLLYLINQILEFRKIESGTLKLITRKGDLVQFIEDLSGLFCSLAEKRNISFSVYKSNINECVTYFDPDKIEKIVYNLLSNAFKFTPEGGKISIKMSLSEHLDSPEENNANDVSKEYLTISISDTGQGIPEEKIEQIFERYYSDDSKSKYTMENTGIGLSYVKDLVQVHGGKLNVQSHLGEGTIFDIAIPLMNEPGDETEYLGNEQLSDYHFSENIQFAIREMSKESSINLDIANSEKPILTTSTNHGNTKALPVGLIVEDNSDMRDLLRSILKHKYCIYEAINGEQALKILSHTTIDFILSDVMMPKMDGIELCKQIKTSINTSHLPVILLTAKSFEEHQIEGLETGADDYIVKPFSRKVLPAKIDSILENRRVLKEKFSKDFSFEPKEIKLPSADKEFLNKLVELMEKHISDIDFNIDKMAKMMCISHAHFILKVKNLTGQKPNHLLKTYRLKRAKQLLRQNEISISEVAYSVGYDNPSSFTRAFKAQFKQSPTEFMESVSS